MKPNPHGIFSMEKNWALRGYDIIKGGVERHTLKRRNRFGAFDEIVVFCPIFFPFRIIYPRVHVDPIGFDFPDCLRNIRRMPRCVG